MIEGSFDVKDYTSVKRMVNLAEGVTEVEITVISEDEEEEKKEPQEESKSGFDTFRSSVSRLEIEEKNQVSALI